MVRASAPSALNELHDPSNNESQIEALKQLKNEIVGHDQRKELIINHGVVGPLVRILGSGRRKDTVRRETNGEGLLEAPVRAGEAEWNQEEEIRLQATLVVGSLGLAGPAFVAPLLNGGVIQPLLDSLQPQQNPSKLIIATLRTLNVIIDCSVLDQLWTETLEPAVRAHFLDLLYSKNVMDSFYELLSRQQNTSAIQTEVSLAAQLISKSCQEDHYRSIAVKCSILDCLASQLAARLPNADANRNLITDLLEAISAIIQGSNYHAARFLYAKAINNLSPILKANSASDVSTQSGVLHDDLLQHHTTPKSMTLDQLGIPRIPAGSRNEQYSKAFPPPGVLLSRGDIRRSEMLSESQYTQQPTRPITRDDFDCPIFMWLMHIAKKEQGLARLAAIKVTTYLRRLIEDYPSSEDTKPRERALSLLLVPLLVKMIEDASSGVQSKKDPRVAAESRKVLEQAPAVLALLVNHSTTLQKAACDAKVIPLLCQVLKKSFDPVMRTIKPMWKANPAEIIPQDPSLDPASSTLGDAGLKPEVIHALKVRRGALRAISAIADREDEYRKLVIECGAMTCITDAVIPHDDGITSANVEAGPKDGNPSSVLVAACASIKAMSRSVGILRTSLIDCGIAKPILELLKHPSITVQIAATEVLCNLLLHFSPMRDELVEQGTLKMLCDHAHSPNISMRLNSLWALKHAMLHASFQAKIQCLNDLGTGWLVQALSGDIRDLSSVTKSQSRVVTPLGMGTANAAGEQVDLLNAPDEPRMDIDNDYYSSSDDDFEHPIEESPRLDTSSRLLPPPKQLQFATEVELKKRLKLIKDNEMDPSIRGRKEEIQIQEQALDFIRNLINESKGHTAELIEHILKTIGHQKFFDILIAKLKPRPITAAPRDQSPGIILSTIHVLIHIANGKPHQRLALIQQNQLLTLLLPFFTHPDPNIRVALIWLVNNLTWMDDSSDAVSARHRALELRKVGFEDAIKSLVVDGLGHLDCKERAKTAVEQMGKLLEGISTSGSQTHGSVRAGGPPHSDRGSRGGMSDLARTWMNEQ